MAKENKLIKEFYELKVSQLMDKRVWDLPLIVENEDISHVLSILGARNHIWVVKDKEKKELVGVITEHENARYKIYSAWYCTISRRSNGK